MVKRFRSMTYPYIAWIIAIIVVPMLLIVLYAFTTSGNSVLTFQFTFENFARFVTDKVFMDVLLRSLYIALITTLICVALGYPIAYVIAQRGGRSNTILILLITMPTWAITLVGLRAAISRSPPGNGVGQWRRCRVAPRWARGS